MHKFDAKLLRKELASLGPEQQVAFAAACAQRTQPLSEHPGGPTTVSIKELLSVALPAVKDQTQRDLLSRLADSLASSPHADDDAVASAIYTAWCVLKPDAQNAVWAAQRAYDARDHQAHEIIKGSAITKDDEARLLAHPAVQTELARQASDLSELKQGVDAKIIIQRAEGVVRP